MLSLKGIDQKQIQQLLDLAKRVKKSPEQYKIKCQGKTMLMIFQAPSLRTRISFEQAMLQMGGHAIYYDTATSPWGHGKETVEDVANVVSRYVDIVMARIFSHEDLAGLSQHASIPVINALTNAGHPCQILGDLLTIYEKKKKLKGLKLAYVGDCNNNVTFSLLEACPTMGINVSVASPNQKEYSLPPQIIRETHQQAQKNKTKFEVCVTAAQAVKDADVVYTDSWMSYRIPENEQNKRLNY